VNKEHVGMLGMLGMLTGMVIKARIRYGGITMECKEAGLVKGMKPPMISK
jgi:hypothetical protein